MFLNLGLFAKSTLEKAAPWALVLIVCIGTSTPQQTVANTQDGPPVTPTIEELIRKIAKAIGDPEQTKNITKREVVAKMELVGAGLTASIHSLSSSNGRFISNTDIPGIGKMRQGSDGRHVWDINPMTGPRLLDGQERDLSILSIQLNAFAHFKKFYSSAKLHGIEKKNGKPCYKIEAISHSKMVETIWIDMESYLPLHGELDLVSPTGKTHIKSSFTDYRNVNGFMIAFLTKIQQGPQAMKIVIEKVNHKVEIKADAFHLPSEIKALVEKKKKKAAEKKAAADKKAAEEKAAGKEKKGEPPTSAPK